MTDPQRGAYTPQQDAPLQFDPRSPASRRPLPMALIASGTLLIMLIAAVAMYCSRGVRGDNEPPRPVGEPIGALKTAPQAGAQTTDSTADGDAYAPQNVAAAKVPTFAPPPEAVQPRPAAQPQKLTVQTVSPIAIPSSKPKTAPIETARVETPLAKPAAAPAIAAVKSTPAAAPAAKTTTTAARASAPTAAIALAKPAAAKTGTPAAGGVRVQIGAFSSAALADQGYADVATLMGLSIQGKSKHVEPVDKDGHTLYRTTVNGFSDRASAEAFCAALKAKGKICFVKS
jgi:hypothetical protein